MAPPFRYEPSAQNVEGSEKNCDRERSRHVTGMVLTREQIIADAVQAGVDLEMIEYNLTLSYDERARQHDAALALMLELKRIGEEARADSCATA